ncbi:MAG TPA: Na-translocating system protein MpsB [Acidimicrobiales bacterium]|nr:Na-translocating system protein MpsB [Acidimicrobiales bacterium]
MTTTTSSPTSSTTTLTPPVLDALAAAIDEAAALVAPAWPLERFVAVNPLMGLLDRGFPEAVEEARRWMGARGLPGAPAAVPGPRTRLEAVDRDGAAAVTALAARWYALLVDPHGAVAGAPDPWAAWRRLAAADRGLRRLVGRDRAASLRDLPDDLDEVIVATLAALGAADPADGAAELRGQLARLHGWAGYAQWCDRWATPLDPAPRLSRRLLLTVGLTTDALVLDARRCAGEGVGIPPAVTPEPGASATLALAAAGEGLIAAEAAFRSALLDDLDDADQAVGDPPAAVTARAQVVCCIDVRSEPLRRHLEAVGPYDTLGFAGFFGTAVRFRPLGSAESFPSAPVLLDPAVEVAEVPDPRDPGAAESALTLRRRRVAGSATVDDLGHDHAAMYALAETMGWVAGPVALARTVAPGLAASPRWSRSSSGTVVDPGGALDLEARVGVVEGALTTMGLTAGFAPLVVLCGHGATTAANAHAAALDCGACGGNHGGPNARALAAIANDPEVRAALAGRGITIGDGTWFVAAQHDTTTDEVTLFDTDRAPASHQAAIGALEADLGEAGERVAAERLGRLGGRRPRRPGGGSARRAARRRAGDWAQTRPEWGLARNAAFLVGPRALTRGADLGGRVFLHSYDAAGDPDGTALTTILTAPMVVAHWINAQYYFSSVDPDVFGAGDKALHNPVAGVGVLTGEGGDLRLGLPWQWVAGADGLVHEPLRLLVVVEASIERIEAIVAEHEILQHLFDGAWVHLVARGGPGEPWRQRRPGGQWVPARSPAAPTATEEARS